MDLGNIASIVTLILFVFYFVGRVWVMGKEKVLMRESFDVKSISIDKGEPDEEYEIYYDLNGGGEIVSITSEVPILWFQIVQIAYDENFQDKTNRKARPAVAHNEPVNANCPIHIRTMIPEGFPIYRVYFQRYDYAIVSFDIGYDGRFGGMYPGNYKIRHTVKSVAYYMVK